MCIRDRGIRIILKTNKMRTVAIAIISVLCVASFAAKIESTATLNVRDRLDKIRDDDFGKKILDTIALQIKRNEPLAEVSKLMNNIRLDLQNEQRKQNAEHSQKSRECASTLATYNERISQNTQEITQLSFTVSNLQSRLQGLFASVDTRENQTKLLGNREQFLRNDQQHDEADFAARLSQINSVVEALDLVLPRLRNIRGDGDEQEALIQLAKIGKSNPINALLQVSATLDPRSLVIILEKLEQLRESLSGAADENRENLEEARTDFSRLVGELNNVRRSLSEDLSRDRTETETVQYQLQNYRRNLEDTNNELTSAKSNREITYTECERYEASYRTGTERRNHQLELIANIQNILATHIETISDYVRKL
eukprot:TRINITY_DN1315_c0_g1_i11.p1 TRINITY_DN1315_c0_g1~~TRINITY_DN1315_c0_g1_i11.p1  ORF type:complete len:370 (-),score=101.07 TRINITY_DN1315_c0_g1_i11:56-1165(-)